MVDCEPSAHIHFLPVSQFRVTPRSTPAGRIGSGSSIPTGAELDQVRYVVIVIVIGVDVNVNDLPSELAGVATSLASEAGRVFIRAEIAAAILHELDVDYARLKRGEFTALAEEWEHHCLTLGRRVQIHIGERTVSGRAESLDNDGALLLRTDCGHLERIVGGDVTIEK